MKAIDLHNPTIPGGFVANMALGLQQQSSLSDSLRKEIAQLSSKDKVTIGEYINLVEALKASSNDEMLGLLKHPVPQGCYENLCQFLIYCPELTIALQRFIQFYQPFSGLPSLFDISYSKRGVEVRILGSRSEQALDISFARAILLLLCLYKTLCWLSSSQLKLKSVAFSSLNNQYQAEIAYLFGCRCIDNAEDPCIVFDSEGLHSAVKPQSNPQHHAELYLPFILSWLVQDTLANTVYACIAQLNDFRSVSLNSIASQLQTTPHTLARRLRMEHSGFQQVLDTVRFDRARQLLRYTDHSVQEIAYITGYSDASTFSRAFKHWSGLAPVNFRETR